MIQTTTKSPLAFYIMAQIQISSLNIIVIILVVFTFFNVKRVLQDMEEEPTKQVTAAAAAAETQTQTRPMTQAEREQMEIEQLKKDNMYCSYCLYADNIKCDERIDYLKERYGTGYLEGLQEVLKNGKECKAKGLRQ
mmetsp:Transcript_4123/g.5607  ORF Transcript_4123/g.5607 Transcript_4123/m.5607 type:complete len:137 (+) Transcript_4123:53-463(+)